MLAPAAFRHASSLTVALMLAAAPSGARAQIAGENINMVTGMTFPGGDPYLQRQNEPSVAISTVNSDHLLAGANDYRTVDLPNPNSADETGDAWLGVFKSFDGGQTWQSNLIPGYPQDPARTAPLFGLKAAADPLVRAAPGGLFFYSGIAFNRATNLGEVFVARYLDVNNKENGDTTPAIGATDPIQYVGAAVVDSGTAGQFEDKPWLLVDVPRSTNKFCSVAAQVNGTTYTVSIPAFNVYFAYAVFTGSSSSPSSKIMLATSTDCGATWGKPQKLSESNNVNQGTNLTIDPVTGAIYVTWRRFATSSQADAILMAKSTNGGATFTKAYPVVSNLVAFDQNMTGTMFRTEALPSAAVSVVGSGSTAKSWVHVGWAQRSGTGGDAQVVVATSPGSDGVNFSAPVPVDPSPITDDYGHGFGRGHQFMPALTFSQGRLVVLYYDSRLDHTRGYYRSNNPFQPDASGRFYTEDRGPLGDLAAALGTAWPTLDDSNVSLIRHTIDVRVAYAFANPTTGFASPSFTATNVSQYPVGTTGSYAPNQTVPAFGGTAETTRLSGFTPPYMTGNNLNLTDGNSPPDILFLEQLAVNPPNLPIFAQGKLPFIGDYIDVAGLAFVPTPAAPYWAFATASAPAPVFHAVWTTNQDVVVPFDANGNVNWALYTPPGTSGTSTYDPTQTRPACTPGSWGSRNQNIYTARLSEGLRVSSPQNIKPLNTARAYVVAVQNTTGTARKVAWTIASRDPSLASATFDTSNPGLTTTYGTIAPHSTQIRTLFVTPGTNTPTWASVLVNVNEVTFSGNSDPCIQAMTCAAVPGGLSGSLFVNPPAAPGAYSLLASPDGFTGSTSTEVYAVSVADANVLNANVLNTSATNANVLNANVLNANVLNANVLNANVLNTSVWNASLRDANVLNANVLNANVLNANVLNANVLNASVADGPLAASVTSPSSTTSSVTNSAITTSSVTDATYVLANTGNTAHTYRIKVIGTKPTGAGPIQMILTKTYSTPTTTLSCTLGQEGHTVLVATVDDITSSIVSLDTFLAQPNDPGIPDTTTANATISLAPGETGQITFRGAVDALTMAGFVTQMVPAAIPHAANTFASPLFIGLPSSGTSPRVGVPYSVTLVYGGTSPYSLSLASGTLPPGLSLGTAGLSGTPQQAGTFTFTLTATDASNATVTTTLSLTVSTGASSVTAISATPSSPTYSQSFTVSATVSGGGPAPTGNVTYYDLGVVAGSCPAKPPSPLPSSPLGSAAVGAGLQVAGATLAAGQHCLVASYSGDANYLGSAAVGAVTIVQAPTSTTVNAQSTVISYGSTLGVTVTVAPVTGSGTPTGSVSLYDLTAVASCPPAALPNPLPAPVGTSQLVSGSASFSVSGLSPGGHCLVAPYGGDGNFLASRSGASVTVGPAPTTTIVTSSGSAGPISVSYGQAVPLSVVVTAPPGTGTPSGTVTITVQNDPSNAILATATLSGGSATLSVPTTGLTPGTTSSPLSYVLVATYTPAASTPAIYATSNGTLTILLSQGTVTVTLAAKSASGTTLSSAVYGQPVTLVANVTSGTGGTPTGSVTFYDGATSLGSAPLSSPTITLGALTVGGHSFSAIYGGDADFPMTASAALSFPVSSAATTTTVSASPSTVSFGQAVTLSAQVAVSSPSLATADGAVTYYDVGSTCPTSLPGSPPATGSLGSAAVGATVSVTTLTAGTHCVVGYYASSSGNFQASRGSTLVTVNGYRFNGFLSPLATAQLLSSPSYSSYSGTQNYGSAVPFKWYLYTSAGSLLTTSAPLRTAIAYINSSQGCRGAPSASDKASASSVTIIPPSKFTGNSTLKVDPTSGLWQFNWDTSTVTKSCYTMALTFDDGSTWATNIKLQ